MNRASGKVRVGRLDLCFEAIGDPASPALLLVMGFGVQLTDWPLSFVGAFADAGFFVVRYDHRDCGLSSKLEGEVAYALSDMADDGIALLRALGIGSAHVLGASMGGMIAQEMAIRHPGVVRSLCSVMSTTGAPDVGLPDPSVWTALTLPPPETRDEVIERALLVRRLVSGQAYPLDEVEVRRRAAAAYDRSWYPPGLGRHRIAVGGAPDRTEALGRVILPALVIHGSADPLVSVTGGIATAQALPDAELLVLPGMGHEFPVELEGRLVDEVARHARRPPRLLVP